VCVCFSAPGAAGTANEDKRRAQTQAEHHPDSAEERGGEEGWHGGRPVRETERDRAPEITTRKSQREYCCWNS